MKPALSLSALVTLAGVEIYVSGATFARMVRGGFEQRSPETATAALGDDVELLEVGVERAREERGTQSELGESVGSLAC